jgi:hypothetical protein
VIVKTFLETQPGLVWCKRIEDKAWLTTVSHLDRRGIIHTISHHDAGIFGSSMAPLWLTL